MQHKAQISVRVLLDFQGPGREQPDCNKCVCKASLGSRLSPTGPSAFLAPSRSKIPEVRPRLSLLPFSINSRALQTYQLSKPHHLPLGDILQVISLSSSKYLIAQKFKKKVRQGDREILKDFFLLPSFSSITWFHFIKDQEGLYMSVCTNEHIMKKSVNSSVTVREHKWIPQGNNWTKSDSLSAQLGEMQCSQEKKD